MKDIVVYIAFAIELLFIGYLFYCAYENHRTPMYKPRKDKKYLTMDEYKDKLISYILNAPKKDGEYIISSATILEMAKEELIKKGMVVKELTQEEKNAFKNQLMEYFQRAEQKKSPTNYWYLLNAESIFDMAKDVLIKQDAKKYDN